MSEMTWAWTGLPATLADVQGCVGKGWHGIVARLVDDLFALGWNGRVYQVKEKFGGLRFYAATNGASEIHDRIEEAMNESYKTCEECGEPGVIREDRSWIQTLCEEHARG